MPRGIPSDILNLLDDATFDVWYLLRVTLRSGVKTYCEGVADGLSFESHTYSARLMDVSSLQYAIASSQSVSFKLANIDGAITVIDQAESFLGALVEFIEYFPVINQGYVRWHGYADELSEITNRYATIPAYGGSPTSRADAPRRTVQALCTWNFKGNNAAWVSALDFESAECPYQRVSTVGFTTNLSSSMTNVTSSMAVNALPNSRFFRNGDYVQIASEILVVTSGGGTNSLTVLRGQRGTTAASHTSGTQVLFASCQKAYSSCQDRGMAGNNTSDLYNTTVKRNYFGSFPMIADFRPNFSAALQKALFGSVVRWSGNNSAYGATVPLVYGRVRIQSPTLLVAKQHNSDLETVWVVAEGLLATNATDASQTTPLNAYATDAGGELVFVNGARRHGTIQVRNGGQDQPQPFLTGITQFDNDALGFFGTAWISLAISMPNNPTVDPSNLTATGDFEVRYGRVVRVYTDESTYTRKATTSPAWVLLDFQTTRRGGAIDVARFKRQDFVDFAAYCATTVSSTIDGSNVPRWTFNGSIDTARPVQDITSAICLGAYTLPPFIGVDGTYRIKPLKSESLVGIPVFTSKASSNRNILWDADGSRLVKSRQSLLKIPNEIRVNFMSYESAKWIKTQLVVGNEEAQTAVGSILGDSTTRVISKTVDLPGTITIDEAARLATLVLRAGEFARGGLQNNLQVVFPASYRYSSDIAIGDIIGVEDDKLDGTTEYYYRVIDISDGVSSQGGANIIERTITATLHTNSIYDDTALAVYNLTRIEVPVAYDSPAPPITSFAVSEAGVYDANNQFVSRVTFTYTAPSPVENFKSVAIYKSDDDGSGGAGVGAPSGNWKYLGDITDSGTVLTDEITGSWQHYVGLSRNNADNLPDINTLLADAVTYKYPRAYAFVDGITGNLPAPTGLHLDEGDNQIYLVWDKYTGDNFKLFKYFEVLRHTSDSIGSATLLSQQDGTFYLDASSTVRDNTSSTFYYWVRGVTVTGLTGPASSTTSGTHGTSHGPLLTAIALTVAEIAAIYLITDALTSHDTATDADVNTLEEEVNDIDDDIYGTGGILERLDDLEAAGSCDCFVADDYYTKTESDDRYIRDTDLDTILSGYALETYVDGGDSFLQGQIDDDEVRLGDIESNEDAIFDQLDDLYTSVYTNNLEGRLAFVEGDYVNAGFVDDSIATFATDYQLADDGYGGIHVLDSLEFLVSENEARYNEIQALTPGGGGLDAITARLDDIEFALHGIGAASGSDSFKLSTIIASCSGF